MDLRRYFGIDLQPGAVPFTGSRFEHLAGGGDRLEAANVLTADDLIAVQTLSVTIPTQTALDLLGGDLGPQLSELLSSIPSDVDMAEADTTDLAPGSAADRAWHFLNDQTGIGWVTAGKLLARNRPRLLPVHDQVIRCILGRPRSFWLLLHAVPHIVDYALHRKLLALRQSAGVPESVSALRVCDVVLWMCHHVGHRGTSCVWE
ncbi:DUF6308 family protein [Streptomyces sp. NRRL F-5122]|uniref:DUF6308 family protein n=1 Tax=Streptomyces sp. NRRL F-5122 TaxID=1609098 RepID=UPI000AF29B04|nr:DUF6308 family protein [Streptomyces sp. NRRL F-5122]